jgi:hypothetical protein
MSLPTEVTIPQVNVGPEGGDCGTLAVLDSSVCRDMRWCAKCGGEQVFVEVYEFADGRVGVCLGCGDERIERFTRTTAEAA